MTVVFDTNVLVSAFVFQGLAADVFNRCHTFHAVIVSERIIEEFHHALEQKIGIPRPDARHAVRLLREGVTVGKPAGPEPDICRDRDDNHVLHLAHSCKANLIVTGDRDLLEIGVWEGVEILSPRQFRQRFG